MARNLRFLNKNRERDELDREDYMDNDFGFETPNGSDCDKFGNSPMGRSVSAASPNEIIDAVIDQ